MSDHNQPLPGGGRRTGRATLETGETVELARPLTRLGARIIDGIIQYVPLAAFAIWAVASMDFFGRRDPLAIPVASLVAIWVICYEFVQIAVWGQTIGKRMTRIKVISAAHGGVPGWGGAIIRWIVPVLPGLIVAVLVPSIASLVTLLCYVSLTWDRVFQGWHDKAARTLVVRI